MHITDGSLEMVRCPATSCNKPFETEELRAFVDGEAFERWERLTLQKELDQMAVSVDPLALESPVCLTFMLSSISVVDNATT